jgi:hypothetical protein
MAGATNSRSVVHGATIPTAPRLPSPGELRDPILSVYAAAA